MPTLIKYILLTILSCILFACVGPPEHKPIDSTLFEYEMLHGDGHQLHVAKSGNDQKPPVIMIHGTPGNWETYGDLMQDSYMQKNYSLYSIDRLGWGKSISTNKTIESQFKPHTDSIDTLLRHIYTATQKKSIIVGHSLGASLAPMVAIESPDYVKGIIIIAGDIDPKFGEPRWYNALADLWLIKKILPDDLAKANEEIMPLKQELLNMNARLQEIQVPITIIHGTEDKLVSYDNVAYAENALQHLGEKLHIVPIQNAGHFIIWEHIPTVIESINNINKQ